MTVVDTSSCGCVWERQKGYGDVIVQQCDEHRRASESEVARRAFKAADRYVLKLRLKGVIPWPK